MLDFIFNSGMEYKTNNDLVLNFINQPEDNMKNNTPTVQVPTKVFISNPNGKKVIVKPYTSKSKFGYCPICKVQYN